MGGLLIWHDGCITSTYNNTLTWLDIVTWGQYYQLYRQFHVITGPNCLADKIYELQKNPQMYKIIMD
jgi:hypothetical protein